MVDPELEPVILEQARELVSSIAFWKTPPDATTASEPASGAEGHDCVA